MNLVYKMIHVNQKQENEPLYYIILNKDTTDNDKYYSLPYTGNYHMLFVYPVIFEAKYDGVLYISIRNFISNSGPTKIDAVERWCNSHINIVPIVETIEPSQFYLWEGIRLSSGRRIPIESIRHQVLFSDHF